MELRFQGGIQVVRPSELTTMNYDYIYLASHKAYEIYRDLITDGIEKKKIGDRSDRRHLRAIRYAKWRL